MKRFILSILVSAVCGTMMALNTGETAYMDIIFTGAGKEGVISLLEKEGLTNNFDNLYDGRLMRFGTANPYAYSMVYSTLISPAGDVECDVVGRANLLDTYITFEANSASSYEISFDGVEGVEYTLYDLVENKSVVIADGNTMSFSATPNTKYENRFVLTQDTYIRTNLNIGDYGTLCLPRTVSAAAKAVAGADFFEIAGKDATNLYFDEVADDAELVAGHPYMFQATATTLTCALSGAVVAAPLAAVNGLHGSFVTMPQGSLNGMYIVLSDRIKACDATYGGIRENRCYIDLDEVPAASPAAPGRRRIAMAIDDATGVENVEVISAQKALINGQVVIIREGQMYNMNGQVIK